jgi:hypothetical protein
LWFCTQRRGCVVQKRKEGLWDREHSCLQDKNLLG